MATIIMVKEINIIKELLATGKTYKQISHALIARHGPSRGFSEMSIRLFCKKHGLRDFVSADILNSEVSLAVSEVGCVILVNISLREKT